MKRLLLCLFLLGAKELTWADEKCACGWTNKGGEGEEKKVNEFPFMVALINPNSKYLYCGGTLVTPRHVLTAAHCTFRYTESRRKPAVVVGEINANNLEKGDVSAATYNVERIIEHFDHNRLSQKNDISLLYLERSVPFNDGEFGPACLPSGPIDLDGKKVKALAWARIAKTEDEYYDGLVRQDLDALKVQKCIDASGVPMAIKDEETICTLTSGNQETCEVDNGGPLLYLDPATNKYIFAGITSYGSHCANGKPGLSLNVAHYLDWIKLKINETSTEHICTAS